MSQDPLNTPNHLDTASAADAADTASAADAADTASAADTTADTADAASAADTASAADSASAAGHPQTPGTPTTPDSAPEAPHLDFAGSTPYEDYVHADVLTHLQELCSDDPGEMVFLVTTQVMELWFTVLVHEWETAARALREDDLPRALDALRRSRRELDALNASWLPLAGLTPAQFNSYRGSLGEGSGFQSAMYRRLEFLLGEKSAAMLVPHKGTARAHAELEKALHEPGLYDEALRFLARRGHPVPPSVLDRDLSRRYEPSEQVEAVWAEIYRGDQRGEEVRLGEALTDVGELVWRWRNDHLTATRRAMGSKQGTGGSAGVAWLEKRAAKSVFPELWTARGRV